MALTALSFRQAFDGDDLHVVRGVTLHSLAKSIELRDPAVSEFAIHGDTPPAHIRIRFRPHFQPEPPATPDVTSGHGVRVNDRTGLITVLPAPAGGRRLRNFMLTISAQDTNTQAELTLRVRVHVHDAMVRAWMTPATLTIRPDGGLAKFSLFAEFDDKVIGDISNWGQSMHMTWSFAVQPPGDPAGIESYNSSIGWVRGKTPGTVATMSVVHNGLTWPGPAPTGTVRCVEPWASPRQLTWIAGKDPRKWQEIPNVLLLPDGFVDGERDLFLALARNIVRKVHRSPILRPFDLLKDEMNFWTAFVPSPESGVNVLYEVCNLDATGLAFTRVPLPEAPAESAETWNLSQLVHEVGLPVAEDRSRGLDGDAGLLKVWQRVYGPKVTRRRVEKFWKDWLLLASRTLLNERDTLFALGLGSRPRAAGNRSSISLGLRESERARTSDLEDLLVNLVHSGEPVGTVWRIAGPDSPFLPGKDKGLVGIVSRTRLRGGTNHADYYTASLHTRSGQWVRPGAPAGLDIQPLRIKLKAMAMPAGEKDHPFVDVDDPPFDGVGIVVHETGHSLHLGDEYGLPQEPGWRAPPPATRLNLTRWGNLQDQASLLVSGRLRATNSKWANWHRIEKAGVLAQAPPASEGAFRLTLKPGHAGIFSKDELIRLRKRPLVSDGAVSHVLRVTASPTGGQALLDVEVAFPIGEAPTAFEAGSVVMKMARWPRSLGPAHLGSEFMLMAENIRAHINTTGLPSNASSNRALAACELDDHAQQRARNLPDGIPKCQPRNRSRIVGLFEGGAQYHCEVYHPTGACVMRAGHLEESLSPFCPVCRYLLVDQIDPTKHGIIDADYVKIYPDSRA
jgi:hypothetical protein